jgi:hypothetical protein
MGKGTIRERRSRHGGEPAITNRKLLCQLRQHWYSFRCKTFHDPPRLARVIAGLPGVIDDKALIRRCCPWRYGVSPKELNVYIDKRMTGVDSIITRIYGIGADANRRLTRNVRIGFCSGQPVNLISWHCRIRDVHEAEHVIKRSVFHHEHDQVLNW